VKGIYKKWSSNSKNIIDDFMGQFDKRGRTGRKSELESMASEAESESP
jgi:hypothetical protein